MTDVLLFLALVCFVADALGVGMWKRFIRYDLTAAGLACITAWLLVEGGGF